MIPSKHPKLFTEYVLCLSCFKSANPEYGLVKIGICQSTSNLRAHKKFHHPKEYEAITNISNLKTPQSVIPEEMCSYARAEGVNLPPLEWETRLNRREKGKDMRSDFIRLYVKLMPKTDDKRGRHVPGACLTRLSCSSPTSVNRQYDRP